MTSSKWTPDMVIGILDYLISHPRRRWPNLDTNNGGQGHAGDAKPRCSVWGPAHFKDMVDRMIRMARLVSLLIDMLTILFLLLP